MARKKAAAVGGKGKGAATAPPVTTSAEIPTEKTKAPIPHAETSKAGEIRGPTTGLNSGDGERMNWSQFFKGNPPPSEELALESVDGLDDTNVLRFEAEDEVDWGTKGVFLAVAYFPGKFPGIDAICAIKMQWDVPVKFQIHHTGWIVSNSQRTMIGCWWWRGRSSNMA
ncbi:hypothetical protein ABFS83_02G179100 [Erythranthe nasuta]